MVTALVSALTDRPVRHDIAMTGEISLRGNVLPIGGLKEKTMAAYMAGCRQVLIPADNIKDLDEIDPIVREALVFTPCEIADDVLRQALLPAESVLAEPALTPDPIDLDFVNPVQPLGTTSLPSGMSGRAK
jgi:ATP-dependent Lon protease